MRGGLEQYLWKDISEPHSDPALVIAASHAPSVNDGAKDKAARGHRDGDMSCGSFFVFIFFQSLFCGLCGHPNVSGRTVSGGGWFA